MILNSSNMILQVSRYDPTVLQVKSCRSPGMTLQSSRYNPAGLSYPIIMSISVIEGKIFVWGLNSENTPKHYMININ